MSKFKKACSFSIYPVLAVAVGLGVDHFGTDLTEGDGWMYVLGGIFAAFVVLILFVAISTWRENRDN